MKNRKMKRKHDARMEDANAMMSSMGKMHGAHMGAKSSKKNGKGRKKM